MKKLILLMFILLSAGMVQSQGNNLNISGYVTIASSGAAVEGYPVNISGPNNSELTVYTNNNGWYNALITNGSVIGPNQLYVVYTEDSCSLAYLADTISNQQGTVDEAVVNFEICGEGSPLCQALFSTYVSGSAIYAENFSTGESLEFVWTINGESFSTGENLVFNGDPGNYTICLNVSNGVCENSSCSVVVIEESNNDSTTCNANFVFNSEGGPINNGYQLIPDAGFQTNTEYVWLLDGDVFSYNHMPQELPVTAGEHTICHIVFTQSCVDTVCQTVVIPQDTLQGCQAYFEWAVAPNNPNAVIFTDASYIESENAEYQYYYNNTLLGSTAISDYNFGAQGSYVVCLTIATENCSDTYCTTVVVPGNGNPGECDADFDWFVSTNPVNGASFVNLFATGSNPGSQTEHIWYFANGATQSGAEAEFLVNAPGIYNVCHIVQNNVTNCFDSLCVEIVVFGDTLNDCSPSFTSSVSMNNPLRMIFMNTSNSNNEPAEYVWDFGDGSTATSNNAEHTYEVAGHYIVCLTIFTANCSNTICEMVVVPGEAGTTLSLGGQVFAGNYNADLGSARLFLLDPVSMAVELIQTATLDSGSYLFTGLESGTYLIKAGLNENSEYYGNYVPTYFGSQYYWFDAQPVYLTENGFDYHISLIWAGNNGGPGWVNGDIDDGPYRIGGAAGASSAALVSNADVIVSDLSGNPQRFTISDVNGEFMIADLAFGTYRLMADVAGMVCIPVEFTISENTPNVSISLVMGDEITGLAETQETSLPVVYPNPAVEQFNIRLNLKQKETLNITITTTAGQLIRTESRTLSAGTQTLGVPVSDIANGIYFIRLLDANNKTIGVHKISVMH
jgi:hypothetical protein